MFGAKNTDLSGAMGAVDQNETEGELSACYRE